jgi:NAD(P)-dependent dehydrogenase (short-subunit alcohol dehydrogenase family)
MNVLITGCSRGIGKAMLDLLIANPRVKSIYALSSNTQIIFNSSKVIKVNADFLTDSWEVNLKNSLQDKVLNLVINNAGYLFNGSIEDTSEEEIHKTYRINYFAPLRIIQLMLPNIKEGKAHIVNIGSMGGFSGSVKYPGLSVYSSSKAALANLSECWAEELKDYGVRSNCLALGAVNTEMLQTAFPEYQAPLIPSQMASKIIDFALNYGEIINGKILPFSLSTP